jgi:hypothetical protein
MAARGVGLRLACFSEGSSEPAPDRCDSNFLNCLIGQVAFSTAKATRVEYLIKPSDPELLGIGKSVSIVAELGPIAMFPFDCSLVRGLTQGVGRVRSLLVELLCWPAFAAGSESPVAPPATGPFCLSIRLPTAYLQRTSVFSSLRLIATSVWLKLRASSLHHRSV